MNTLRRYFPILVSGPLDKIKIAMFVRELSAAMLTEATTTYVEIIIDSNGCPDLKHGMPALETLEQLVATHNVQTKIYRAGSLAALIALLIPDRTIVEEGYMWLHRGNTDPIEFSLLGNEGQVPMYLFKVLRAYSERLYLAIETTTPALRKHPAWTHFVAAGDLRLSATECLTYDIVRSIV